MCSVCPFVWEWNAINNFVLMPNILFNFLVNSTANCSPLSDTILSSNPCSLHMLSLKSLANPSAVIPSVVATKCVIFDSLSQTTKITSFSATIGNLVMKSTNICVYGFSRTSPNFNFLVTFFVLFFIRWHKSYPSTYLSTSFVTSGHQ